MDLTIGEVTGAARRHGRLERLCSIKATTARYHASPATLLPFFGLTMKLGPVAELGLAT